MAKVADEDAPGVVAGRTMGLWAEPPPPSSFRLAGPLCHRFCVFHVWLNSLV